MAECLDKKTAEIALAWWLRRPGVTAPIVGARKMYQLEEVVEAIEIKLSAEDMAALEEPYRLHSMLGHE